MARHHEMTVAVMLQQPSWGRVKVNMRHIAYFDAIDTIVAHYKVSPYRQGSHRAISLIKRPANTVPPSLNDIMVRISR